MPKITAPTVVEHHANVQRRLVDAAESVLRANPRARLTAGEVSALAGIARTSIYRYVESVDDLAGLVIARHLPAWLAAVDRAVETAGPDSVDRLAAWTRANVEEAARTGHAWLIEAARGRPTPHSDQASRNAHTELRDRLTALWEQILVDTHSQEIGIALTTGIVEAGFRLLEAGMSAEIVADMSSRAVRGMVREIVTDQVCQVPE